MATKIGSLFGDVSLRTANLDKDIAAVGKKLKKLGGKMQGLGKTLSIGLTAPIAAFGAMSVKAFAEQEKAETALRAALAASGQEVEANMASLQRMASEIQKVTTVGDEMSLMLMQTATSMGVQAEDLDKATKGAIGLSKAFNLDLNMAMKASSAALLGQTEMLSRYIPELKNIEDPAERVALVHEKMAQGFSLAEAEAGTTAGRLQQLKNSFGDLQEQIGEIVAEYLTPLIEKLSSLVVKLQEADPAMLKLGVQIAAVAAIAGPFLIILGSIITALSSVVVWVVALGAGLGVVIYKMEFLQEVGEALGMVLYELWSGNIVEAIGWFIALLTEVIEMFTGPFGISFSADLVKNQIVSLFETANRWGAQFMDTLRGIWDWLVKVTAKLPTAAIGNAIGGLISDVAFRAEGGPVSSGSPYIVGEQGPELFVPRGSGTIIPNHAMGGGGQSITMNFAPGLGMDFVSAIKNNRGLLAQMAVRAVKDDSSRRV
jgi:hypothetical protein